MRAESAGPALGFGAARRKRIGSDLDDMSSPASAASLTEAGFGQLAAATTRAEVPLGSLEYLRSRASRAPEEAAIALADLSRVVTLGVGTFGRVYLVRHEVGSGKGDFTSGGSLPVGQAASAGDSDDDVEATPVAEGDSDGESEEDKTDTARSAGGKLYALKVLKKATLVRLKQEKNVVFERAVMAALHHPFLLRLVNTYQDEQHLYMLTEYIQARSLSVALRDLINTVHAGRGTIHSIGNL
jgi:hypothetical protein